MRTSVLRPNNSLAAEQKPPEKECREATQRANPVQNTEICSSLQNSLSVRVDCRAENTKEKTAEQHPKGPA